LAKTQNRPISKTQSKPVVSPVLIGIVVAAAVLMVGGLIVLGNWGNRPTAVVDLSQFPAKGKPDAPVTIVEYSDYG
jgi:protein-disulfide isomerase